MTRQDELNEAWCKYRGKCSTELIQALSFALRWCGEHPHWISVEDELPKEDGVYLFLNRDGDVYTAYYWTNLKLIESVTHWMPTPQAPVLSNSENTGGYLKGGEQ